MIERVRILFTGIVQGVGFRPFIFRAARTYSLTGFVQNRSDGVLVEVEGPGHAIGEFVSWVQGHPPILAQVTETISQEIEPLGEKEFRIIQSHENSPSSVLISPDIATCDECIAELFDPGDRRFRYPFINCINCGPRLTIIRKIPYDRCNTSMAAFELCPHCAREYTDPADRRFHAQPNACNLCGPSLSLHNHLGETLDCPDPVARSRELLKEGFILAVKGLGGFHLAVDATNDTAVSRLRKRKHRESKPLAIMVPDARHAGLIAEVSEQEESLLTSPVRPIVLLRKKPGTMLSASIAPDLAHLGIMLPYTPLHHLLFEGDFPALVMTSGNQKDEPICIGNDEAFARLRGIADHFLVHNRDIIVRCDDSIALVESGSTRLSRRSRGFTPRPVPLEKHYPDVLALGGQMKSSICIIKDDLAFLSPHIGDMETPQAIDFFHENIALLEHITQRHPGVIACDLHQGYYPTRFAGTITDRTVIPVQHHHAHIVSCMAENRITGDVLGLALDGTGYGEDGRIWGGEFLRCDESSFTRIGHIGYFPLPGGEKAIREPWRIAASLMKQAYGTSWHDHARRLNLVPETCSCDMMDTIMDRGINTPLTSSMGRVFDGVASILGVCGMVNFEGQAAMQLEAIAEDESDLVLPYGLREEDLLRLDLSPLIRALAEARIKGEPVSSLAGAFHRSMVRALGDVARAMRRKTSLNRIVLSGGCFQNRLLLRGCIDELISAGFVVFTHRHVPTNDGGLALGQALCAAERVNRGLVGAPLNTIHG